jgi:hypothetical protein
MGSDSSGKVHGIPLDTMASMAYLQYLATPRILATLIVGARWSKELIWQDSFMQHFAPAMFTDEGKRL